MPVLLPEATAPLADLPLARLTAEEYQTMTESGVLPEAPIELLDGLLVWKDRRDHEGSLMNIGVRHSLCVDRLHRLLDQQSTGHGCFARSQLPIRISDLSVPEPDISVVLGNSTDYRRQHPTAEQTWLVVEVSDSSLKRDRECKLSKYAAAGIPTYWIINLVNECVEVFSTADTDNSGYINRIEKYSGDLVELRLPDSSLVQLSVSQILDFE